MTTTFLPLTIFSNAVMTTALQRRVGGIVAALAARDLYNTAKRTVLPYIGNSTPVHRTVRNVIQNYQPRLGVTRYKYYRRRYISSRPCISSGMAYRATRRSAVARGLFPRRLPRRWRRDYYARRKTKFQRKYSRLYRARKRIGRPIGQTAARCTKTLNYDGQPASRVLLSWDLTAIEQEVNSTIGTALLDMTKRISDRINLRGFRIEGNFTGEDAMNRVHRVHMAIIAPKNTVASWGTGSSDIVPNDRFFKDTGVENGAQNFTTALNSNELHTLPINTDEHYILWRSHYDLIPRAKASSGNFDQPGTKRAFKFYVPIKRQVKYGYTSGDDLPQHGRCALVVWHDNFKSTAGTASQTLQMRMQVQANTYWRPLRFS